MPTPVYFFWRFTACADSWDQFCEAEELWYEKLASTIKFLTVLLWIAAWLFLELRSRKHSGRPTPKLLTHLRYGPLAVLILSFAAIISFDMLLIQYSRWQIVGYIHSNASPQERPSFKLHNNYRHWCGNGMAANKYELYGSTPAAYIDDPDPKTRARALQASMYVYDWINLPGDGPSMSVVRKAAGDPDPMVRELAATFQAELGIAP
jgi:hypothetical protein